MRFEGRPCRTPVLESRSNRCMANAASGETGGRKKEVIFLARPKMVVPVAALLLIVALFFGYKRMTSKQVVSEFGKYAGYSSERFDGTRLLSDYLTLPDGKRLAYDLILPTQKGAVTGERLPTLFKYTPYLRTWTIFDKKGRNLIADFIDLDWKARAYLRLRYWLSPNGRLFDPLFRTRWLETMVKHGYAVIIVERPGTGASFGVINPDFEANAVECDELFNWIAAQPWSDGKIGMFGDSFQAMVQIAAASTGNPHLKAIFPAATPIELYDSIEYRGGVYNQAFSTFFAGAASHLETLVTPVQTDKDGTLLAQARQERRSATLKEQTDLSDQRYAFRDALTPRGQRLWDGAALWRFLERINRSGVAVYLTSGWYDLWPADGFFWYENLTVPKRLTMRPLDHTGMDKTGFDLDYAAEALRWFDYWLKDIPNGIMDEPGIHYYVMGAPRRTAWHSARSWPPEGQSSLHLFFSGGKSGTAASANDGMLSDAAPTAPAAFDVHTVDYSTTTGSRSRWTAVNWPRRYPDMRRNDTK
ncbi:MAG TPA: CocE/NonD family hydrolase, partial [bacterium]|nr:CocE/NonD family hydrolase [bacterium]